MKTQNVLMNGLTRAVPRRWKNVALATPIGWLNVFRLGVEGGLAVEGWPVSFRRKEPVDSKGRPIPWYTYAAQHFLAERLPPNTRVFEFGCGFSTVWYATRCASVVAVDNEPGWARRIGEMAPANTQIIVEQDLTRYPVAVADRGLFGLVAIDGVVRQECLLTALSSLEPSGVMVWDNSDRSDFEDAGSILLDHGFRWIRFWGMGPIGITAWETAILYRSGNCLGL